MRRSFYGWNLVAGSVGFWMRDLTFNQWLTVLYCFRHERRAEAPWVSEIRGTLRAADRV